MIAGQTVQGFVHINQSVPFPATDLTIGLYGTESTYCQKHERRNKRTVIRDKYGMKEIIHLVFPIQHMDGMAQPGQYTFPFALTIPDWLPASMVLAGQIEKGRLSITYSIQAQFTPANPDDWSAPGSNRSSYCGSRVIFVYRPTLQIPTKDLSFSLVSEVGGFMGISATKCVSEIIFEKNEYYLGEQAKVKIICDNSACDKDVKSFKFKLHRYYRGDTSETWVSTSASMYLSRRKETGCKAFEKVERDFLIDIPVFD